MTEELMVSIHSKNNIRPEPENDGLQPAIDTYVKMRQTSDNVDRYVENHLNQFNLTTAQYGVLLHLMIDEPLSMTDLKKKIFRSNSAITSISDILERDGLVERSSLAGDRRITTLILTPKGVKLLKKVRAVHRSFLGEMMSCFSVDELMQLRSLLVKVDDFINTQECNSE